MCCSSPSERRVFLRHCAAFSDVLVSNTLAAAPVIVFLVTAAAVADGYFAESTRYVYEFWTLNATGGVNSSFFATVSEPLAQAGTNSTPQPWENTGLWVNLSREIPPGQFCNESWSLPVPGYPGVPGISLVSERYRSSGRHCDVLVAKAIRHCIASTFCCLWYRLSAVSLWLPTFGGTQAGAQLSLHGRRHGCTFAVLFWARPRVRRWRFCRIYPTL